MKLVLLILLLISSNAIAHEAGETQAQIGPGKAVEAYDEHNGIRLSEKAQKTIQIETLKITMPNPTVPLSALLMIQANAAVFLVREGWFKMIRVEAQKGSSTAKIISKEIKAGDEIVTRGAALLRVAIMNVAEEDEDHEGEHKNEHEGQGHDKEKNEKHEHDHEEEHK